MPSKPSITLDLGGTKIKIAIVQDGHVLSSSSIDSFSKNGLQERLPSVKNVIDELLIKEKLQPQDAAGVGISVPGIVDSIQKKVLSIDKKFCDAPGIDFSKWVYDNWGLPLAMDNDARCAMLGEWQYGSAKGYDDAVIMTLGTGIGSSAIMHGKIIRGRHFMAGILGGHSTINIHGSICNCGNIGCGETEIATWNIEEKIRHHNLYQSSLLQHEIKPDFETVFRLAQQDELSKIFRDKAMDVWSTCAVNLIHAYDPEVLVLSGGIMQSSGTIIPYMQQKISQYAWTPWGKVSVVKAMHAQTASLLGAAYLINQNIQPEH